MYYYKQLTEGVTTSVESKSVKIASPDFVEATKVEYDNFLNSLPVIEPPKPRDLAKEIDDLNARITALEPKGV